MVFLLELARGLAALWVFLYHSKVLFENSSPLIFHLSSYGSLGVPMFFVISGYVITFSAESSLKNNRSPMIFLKKRFLRIYPTFWASIIVVLIIPYIIEAFSSLESGAYIAPESVFKKLSPLEWVNFIFLTKIFWATSPDLQSQFNTINSVYWTLAIEFQFYLIIFFSLFFGKYYRSIITLISILGFVVMFFPIGLNHGLFIHYWPSFSIGIGLAYLHRNGIVFNPHKRRSSSVTAFIILLVIVLLILRIKDPRLPEDSLIFSVSFGMFLWIISSAEKILSKIKNGDNKLLYWLLEPWLLLGAMSYSVYLLHGKIYGLPNMFVRQAINSENVFYGIFTIIGTLLICFPFYYYIERRFLSKNYKELHQEVLKKATS